METQLNLIEVPKIEDLPETSSHGKPRLNAPTRNQVEFTIGSLDDAIPQNHVVRFVWDYVYKLDVDNILGTIQSVEGNAGRPATHPKILLALWLYATLEGIISARVIADYCEEHIAFKWLCGGVNINHHTLSDFSVKYSKQFDEFLIQSVAILEKEGFVDLEEVSQDGMRVRASAGKSSFRREPTLLEFHERAEKYLEQLRKELKENPTAGRSKKEAAKLRAAEEREKQVKKALDELKKLKEEKKKKTTSKGVLAKFLEDGRTSITDPEARKMKMACGGFEPAYNVQFATTKKGRVIVGVDVNNSGNDKGLIKTMIDQIYSKYGKVPLRWLVDAGYSDNAEINKTDESYENCKIYMPPKKSKSIDEKCYLPHPKDTEAVIKWRKRMRTEEAKEIYKGRSSTAEFSNAQAANKGLKQFLVRGVDKVLATAYRFAITHNMQRLFSLRKSEV